MTVIKKLTWETVVYWKSMPFNFESSLPSIQAARAFLCIGFVGTKRSSVITVRQLTREQKQKMEKR